MKNQDSWNPTKYVQKNGELKASLKKGGVGYSSLLIASLTAKFYNSNLKMYAQGILLDLGCGNVPLFGTYRNYVDKTVCVDWNNTFHKNDFVDYYVDLNKELPFEESSFDTVLLSDVLEHIKEPTSLWKEINRILKQGGHLILNVPFHYWIHEQPYDYYRYTKAALEYFAEESNFEILILEELGGGIEVLTDFHSKIICPKIPLIGKELAIVIQKLNLFFLKTGVGKKMLRNTSKSFALCYGLVAKKK